MSKLTNSRFITHPSHVDDSADHSIVIIDADVSDIENIGLFCKVCNLNYDLYLYRHELGDLPWLSAIVDKSSAVLINENSSVTITNLDTIPFGVNQKYQTPLDYIQELDKEI